MSSSLFADLSNWNDHFNVVAYHAAGHRIVALKASEGVDFIDHRHRAWALQAHSHGLIVAHYHYGRPDRTSGAEEAAFFLHVTAGVRGPYDYLVYDGERAANGSFGLDAAHCRDFDKHIREHTRYHTVLYASSSQATPDALGDSPWKRYWEANYSQQADSHFKDMETMARQFTDGIIGPEPHSIAGVGQCDVNVARGSLLQRIHQHTH